MGIFEIIVLAFALSADAFAVSIYKGTTLKKTGFAAMIIVGLYFGLSQGIMPLIGYLLTGTFEKYITAYSHWIAFAVLLALGAKMVIGSFKKSTNDNAAITDITAQTEIEDKGLTFKVMLPLAIATSIDALAVGGTLRLTDANVFMAIPLITIITFGMCMLGVKIGSLFGHKIKSKAELIGGILLALIGVRILVGGLL